MTKPPATFGKRLQWLRRRFDMSLEEFAAPLDIGASYLGKLERGDSTSPSVMLIDSICLNFYANRAWLLEGQGKPFLINEFNAIADSGEFIPSPVPDRIWLPFSDNYIDQLKKLAAVFRDYSEQMGARADELEKQSRDFEAMQQEIRQRQARKLELTETATPAIDDGMQGKWPALKKALQAKTETTGKSALAKFLKVDLTRVSQWLTDADSQREPGAEYTLQMQDWLRRQQT